MATSPGHLVQGTWAPNGVGGPPALLVEQAEHPLGRGAGRDCSSPTMLAASLMGPENRRE